MVVLLGTASIAMRSYYGVSLGSTEKSPTPLPRDSLTHPSDDDIPSNQADSGPGQEVIKLIQSIGYLRFSLDRGFSLG